MNFLLRDEKSADVAAISQLTERAFRDMVYASHTEQFIVDALRRVGALTVSLVAEDSGRVIGHVAISPVTISSGATGWYGLGPISVWPENQGQGVGSALMDASLAKLKSLGAAGCVLLGDPQYYARFGFRLCPDLRYPDAPAEYFQAISFSGEIPSGEVAFHPAFEVTE